MSSVKSVKNPKGKVIFFNEADHKYYDKDKNYYNSTTKVIHSLFPEFQKDMMAYVTGRRQLMKEHGCADKSEVPVGLCMQRKKQLLEEWDDNRDMSCEIGRAHV